MGKNFGDEGTWSSNGRRLAVGAMTLLVALGCTRRPSESSPALEPATREGPATELPPPRPDVPARGIEVPPGFNTSSSSPIFPSDAAAREQVRRGNVDMGAGDSTGGDGRIDANAVARIIRGALGGIRFCYERELRTNPALVGRLEMVFTIGPQGRATSVAGQGPIATTAPTVASCVGGRLRGLVFPTPEGGTVDFSFPFTFSPG